jgi:F-type H+-transporting ATPase subunit b
MHEPGFFADPRTWIAVAFVIFFGVFGRKLWAALAGLLDQRAAAVRAELAEAQALRRQAEDMLREARDGRERVLREAHEVLQNARVRAARLAEEAAAEAEAAAARREQMALDRIRAAEKDALDEVRSAAADVAVRAAEQVLREDPALAADTGLVDQGIAGLSAALAGKRAA